MRPLDSVRRLAERCITQLFIDSIWIHRWWGCHRRPDRSFFLRGRQLHVCARCLGLIVGSFLSLLLIPWRQGSVLFFAAFLFVLLVDWGTQRMGWRSSNNSLRFVTGLSVGLTVLPSLLALGGV